MSYIDMMQTIVMAGASLLLISIPLYVVGLLMAKSSENKTKRDMLEMWVHAKQAESMKNAGVDPNVLYASDVFTKKSNISIVSILLGLNAVLFMAAIFLILF